MESLKNNVVYLHQLQRKNKNCIFCNDSRDLQLFKQQVLCLECLNHIRSLYWEGHFTEPAKSL